MHKNVPEVGLYPPHHFIKLNEAFKTEFCKRFYIYAATADELEQSGAILEDISVLLFEPVFYESQEFHESCRKTLHHLVLQSSHAPLIQILLDDVADLKWPKLNQKMSHLLRDKSFLELLLFANFFRIQSVDDLKPILLYAVTSGWYAFRFNKNGPLWGVNSDSHAKLAIESISKRHWRKASPLIIYSIEFCAQHGFSQTLELILSKLTPVQIRGLKDYKGQSKILEFLVTLPEWSLDLLFKYLPVNQIDPQTKLTLVEEAIKGNQYGLIDYLIKERNAFLDVNVAIPLAKESGHEHLVPYLQKFITKPPEEF